MTAVVGYGIYGLLFLGLALTVLDVVLSYLEGTLPPK